MGLVVHHIGRLPTDNQRDYYLYLLDYGWHEPLGEALLGSFEDMAAIASPNKAAVIRGTRGSHFEDEVLTWHGFNGQDREELLPAILITTKHPQYFEGDPAKPRLNKGLWKGESLLLVPLKSCCASTGDVARLVRRMLDDITAKKPLTSFSVTGTQRSGLDGAIVDAVILQPNISGIGVDLKKLIARMRGRG